MNDHSAHFTADMLIHLGRLASQASAQSSLTQAQWAALRFFAHANRFSRRPSAFASFHGTTRGTASQTAKSLVNLGYLRGHKANADGRSVEFELTETGRALLQSDPAGRLVEAIQKLPEEARHKLDELIGSLSRDLDAQQASGPFGSCQDCQYFTPEKPNSDSGRCCYADSPLSSRETRGLCVQYRPA